MRRKREKLDTRTLEERLRANLKAHWVKILEVNGKVYSKYGMGYAVALVPRRVGGVVTGEPVPALVRFNTETGFTTQVIPIDPAVARCLTALVLEAVEELRARATPGHQEGR